MKIINYPYRIRLNNKIERFRTQTASDQIECTVKQYAKIPQMSLINFGSKFQALSDLKTGLYKFYRVEAMRCNLHWDIRTTNPTQQQYKQIINLLEPLNASAQREFQSPLILSSLRILNEEGIDDLSDFDKALVRFWNKHLTNMVKLPFELASSEGIVISNANKEWAKAKRNNDFKRFEPYLAEVFIYTKKSTNHLNPQKAPLDVLFEDISYTLEEIDKIFDDLKKKLIPLAKQIAVKAKINPEILNKPVNIQQLQDFIINISKDMGLDMSKVKIAKAEYSYMYRIDPPEEIGITISLPNTNTDKITVKEAIKLITNFIHEAGHGLVEQGADPKLYRTGLTGAILSIHESQSRLWETMVGRSKSFWQHYYPKLQKVGGFEDIRFDDFYDAITFVEPSLIRVPADEVTYNLHIMLRHDIEKELLNPANTEEDIRGLINKLPETWNNKMEEYLGVRPQTNTDGVLQDAHWSEGIIGCFPSYTIGNLYAAQIMNTAKKEIPDLEKKIANGDLKTLSRWLKEKIYQYGQIYTPTEIIERVTGEPLNPKYFIDYLKIKYLD